MNKKKILLLGGSGFIGCNLRRYLQKFKFDVYNIDRMSTISTPDKYLGFKISNKTIIADIAKINLDKYIKKIKPNFIVNLAAQSHVDTSISQPKEVIQNNINIILNILECLRKPVFSKIKFINISTDEVYGSMYNGTANEKTQINPSSPYSSSKSSVDLIINSYNITYNLKSSILRLSNNYGPYQHPEKFIPTVIFHIKKNKKIPLYGNGKNIREWIYVEDSCEAILKFIKNFKPGMVYNIGSSIRIENMNLLIKILRLFYNKNLEKYFKKVKDRPGHDYRYSINSKKFIKNFFWKPKFSLKRGLFITVKWYMDNIRWYQYFNKKNKLSRKGLIK